MTQRFLPLASLAATSQPETLLRRVVQQVRQLDQAQQSEISTYAQILAGLKFEKNLIRQLFREGMMRESVIYQEILQEGRQEEVKSLVFRLLNRQVGTLPEELRSQTNSLSLEQLESLAEALLEFTSIADVENWLNSQQA
jgi:predicted transposase YdaD